MGQTSPQTLRIQKTSDTALALVSVRDNHVGLMRKAVIEFDRYNKDYKPRPDLTETLRARMYC